MKFIQTIKTVIGDETLRRRILFTVGALVIFRLLATIPMPGIDAFGLERLLASNQFFGLLNVFSGGGISNLSIVMLGVGPYITASIIMQLLTMMFPKMKAMTQDEGEAGRMKLSQYSRYLSVPLAVLQALGLLVLLERQGVIPDMPLFETVISIIVITGGSVLLMWIGELVSEFGIGNGVSLIIFAGIVSSLPTTVLQIVASFDPSQIPILYS
jgi:preprotein translocase subunit SecY